VPLEDKRRDCGIVLQILLSALLVFDHSYSNDRKKKAKAQLIAQLGF
jgi:hypothetical protein